RNYVALSYTHLFNIVTSDSLRINNPFGLQYFNYKYITGFNRISGNIENTVFLPYRLLAFKFAPFAGINVSVITPPGSGFFGSDIYTGISAGVRTRNENLIFGTIEARATYFPHRIDGAPTFKFTLTTDLRYRYASKYIAEPDIIHW